MEMFKEYDVVKSVKELNEKVPKDCKGTVLIVYHDFPSTYEVEFVNDTFETLAILTVKADDIIKT